MEPKTGNGYRGSKDGGRIPRRGLARTGAIPLVLLCLWLLADAGRATAQVPEPDGADLVVLVHGMGRTPMSMWPLQQSLERAGYQVLNFGYSSYGPGVAEIGAALARELERTRSGPAQRVHFVGHSLGNIVIRWLLAEHRPPGAGRVVMLAPPNQGAAIADRLVGPLGWILAPLSELTTSGSTARLLPPPPPDVEVGIIAGDRDGKVRVAETLLPGSRSHAVVSSRHTWIMLRPLVHAMVLRFLRHGDFGAPEGRWRPFPGDSARTPLVDPQPVPGELSGGDRLRAPGAP